MIRLVLGGLIVVVVLAGAAVAEPGDSFQDCSVCPLMVVLPAGRFMMGSPPSEEMRSGDEGPLRQVDIAKPFAVGKFEVTFDEWEACVADGGCDQHRPRDNGWGMGRRPVVNVSWSDAKAYVTWLSKKTGRDYRLLSEAEWEYAARAGTATPFYTGGTIATDQANFNGNFAFGESQKGIYRGETAEVGSFAANAFGLHDFHGNVLEWVEDCWNESYWSAPTDGSTWPGGDCTRHVLRGGSWIDEPRFLRSAERRWYFSLLRVNLIGFRVATTLAP